MVIYGFDVSKSHLDIYGIDQNGEELEKRIPNKLKSIEKFLLSIDRNATLCMEHGGLNGQLLILLGQNLSFKVSLIDAYRLKHSMGNEKGKSDKIDARRIWEYGIRFNDKLIFYTEESETFLELKELNNLRKQLVKQQKMLLATKTSKQIQVKSSRFCHKATEETLKHLKEQINAVENEMLKLISASSDLNQNMDIITSINGVGKITALELILTTGNFKKLDSSKKAAAYAGICPYPNQSGLKAYKSKIHCRTDKRLKSLLYLCGLTVCRLNKDYRIYRDRKLSEGKHYFVTMNNVSNKLLRTIYSMVQSGKKYDYSYLPQDPRLIES